MLSSEEARAKAAKTRSQNLPQTSLPEERETVITIDYFDKTIAIYTNNATVMRRMDRRGIEHIEENRYEGEVSDRTYEFPFEMLGKFVTSGIFK